MKEARLFGVYLWSLFKWRKYLCFSKETFVAIQQIKIYQDTEMKNFAFFASLAISHPIESTYEKTCTAICTDLTKNWTSYKSSDGYGVTTTGFDVQNNQRFDVQIT